MQRVYLEEVKGDIMANRLINETSPYLQQHAHNPVDWYPWGPEAFEAFARREDRLQALSLRPSEYVRRQVRVTPYPTEDVGWILENAGAETLLFSSDFPHVEGGRNPIKRFEESLSGVGEAEKQRFYVDNFVDLMGDGLPAD